MQKLFNKILVPVDFTERSETAVEKAGEIAAQFNCSVHLLHVKYASMKATLSTILDDKAAIKSRLEKMSETARIASNNAVNFEYSIQMGNWDEILIEYANQHAIDLILVGQKVSVGEKSKVSLNPDKLAGKTNVPIITVPDDRRLTRLFNIVIPITDFLPVRKLMYGVYIASNYETTIRLLGVENVKTKDKVMYYMMKSYKLIKDNCDIKVEFEKAYGMNVTDAVKTYAHKKLVDLIILNPVTQTTKPGLLSSLLGRIIQKNSSPPVLTVNVM